MADASVDAQLESLYSRLDAQLKGAQYKKALKSADDSKWLEIFCTPSFNQHVFMSLHHANIVSCCCSPESKSWREGCSCL